MVARIVAAVDSLHRRLVAIAMRRASSWGLVCFADMRTGAVVGDILLRVRLDLQSGPVLHAQIEPVHP